MASEKRRCILKSRTNDDSYSDSLSLFKISKLLLTEVMTNSTLYIQCKPTAALAPFVARYWMMYSSDRQNGLEPRQLIPDGRSDLLFNFADPILRTTHSHASRPDLLKSAFFTGTVTSPQFSQAEGAIDLLGINFHPGGLRALFGLPLYLMKNAPVNFEMACGKLAKEWTDKLFDVHRSARFCLLDQLLLSRVTPIDSAITHSVRLIQSSYGLLPISEIEKEVGACGRSLERNFREWVGVSPKFFSRILRFQRALSLLDLSSRCNLASIALDVGYYDQAHLTKDFRQLTGKPPLSFIKTAEIQKLSDSYNSSSLQLASLE
jgi:AraC-like DNA-binding protein